MSRRIAKLRDLNTHVKSLFFGRCDRRIILGDADQQRSRADIFFGGFTNHLPEDPMKVIGRKPNASRQNIQSQVTLEMRLNMNESRENCLLVLFVGRKNPSASQPNIRYKQDRFLAFLAILSQQIWPGVARAILSKYNEKYEYISSAFARHQCRRQK